MRWSLAFQPCQFTVKHRLEIELTNADSLSWQVITEPSATEGKGGVRDCPPGELEMAVLTGNPRIQDVGEDTQQ